MDWLQSNWFWVLIFILFIGMHMFGHGGHGGHGGRHGGGCDGGHGDEPESGKKTDDAHPHHH